MIPAPPVGKPVAFYDTECYVNFWLLRIKIKNGPQFSFSLRSGERFSDAQITRINEIFELFQVISFNGNYYDVPMIAAALSGFTCEQLKWLSDKIIKEQAKPWELGLPEWKPVDHIDVMNVLPGDGSQKQYAGRIHCHTMRDLPYDPDKWLTDGEIAEVDDYCGNDLDVLADIYEKLEPQRIMRDLLSDEYGIDLRSKSDAQMAEAIIKKRCEEALGQRIYKSNIDWNLTFRYEAPEWLHFTDPKLQNALALVKSAVFGLNAKGRVTLPGVIEGLEIPIGASSYKLGIGGLHSKDERARHVADDEYCIRDNDVASYYPSLILNSGRWPRALGAVFLEIFRELKDLRLKWKDIQRELEKAGKKGTPEWVRAYCMNEGLKILINGTFGKTGSIYSILFAPEMMIQTTVTGQLGLLMLVEWHEAYGIRVISANTDGFVIYCRRDMIHISEALIREWEKRTGLTMETTEYKALYSRDVNNYMAVKVEGGVKRKGEYSKAGLIEKKNPDVEICSDAVAEFLEKGTPILYSIAACRDIPKFVRVQRVSGGAVKLWGEGPRKDMLVRDMTATLEANGWVKSGRKWSRGDLSPNFDSNASLTNALEAYKLCFQPQRPEYLGKVVRWYYGVNSPGPIVYNTNSNTVGQSYGAQPCMTLPADFPGDIDYQWYLKQCDRILEDIAYAEAS